MKTKAGWEHDRVEARQDSRYEIFVDLRHRRWHQPFMNEPPPESGASIHRHGLYGFNRYCTLVDGEPAGVWRGTGKGKRYDLRWRPFGRVDKGVWATVAAEAERIACARISRHRALVLMSPSPCCSRGRR